MLGCCTGSIPQGLLQDKTFKLSLEVVVHDTMGMLNEDTDKINSISVVHCLILLAIFY